MATLRQPPAGEAEPHGTEVAGPGLTTRSQARPVPAPAPLVGADLETEAPEQSWALTARGQRRRGQAPVGPGGSQAPRPVTPPPGGRWAPSGR